MVKCVTDSLMERENISRGEMRKNNERKRSKRPLNNNRLLIGSSTIKSNTSYLNYTSHTKMMHTCLSCISHTDR